MMQKLIVCSSLLLSFIGGHAQSLSKENYLKIQTIEKGIKGYSYDMINNQHWFLRFQSDSLFTRGFVQALKINGSFNYRFDSIKSVSKMYAPDSSFRIFTWQMMKDFTYYRQRGAIQMRTKDGSLKLFPLFDISSFTNKPNDSIRDCKNWIGAIYYKILMNYDGDKKVYTLLGYDDNGPRSNKKWVDILTFNESGIPQFGGKYFNFKFDDTAKRKTNISRYSVEYKKDAKLRMMYDEEGQMIIYDHLTSETNEPEFGHTYIPDGTYEGFKWVNDHWEHIPKLANLSLENGNAPIEKKILDDDGNFDQKKLNEISKQNQKQMQFEEDKMNKKPADSPKKKKATPPQERGEY